MAGIAHSLFLNSLETVINRALLLDPIAEHKVKNLEGKILAVHAHTPEIIAHVIFSGDTIQIFGDPDEAIDAEFDVTDINTDNIDAHMEASSLTFASQALRSEDQGIDSNIKISGDRALVEAIHDIVSNLDIDWEEPLSEFIGDTAAHQLGQFGRNLFNWTKRTARTFIADADVYLREEAHVAPLDGDVAAHAAAVDQTRLDVDALQLRIDTLKKNAGQGHSH
ncbi:MAG: hypothetical protein KUG82_22645 [Pseudomonadales bacterium]|nr:hypothetical protein [Pseudomonadales bacterium]